MHLCFFYLQNFIKNRISCVFLHCGFHFATPFRQHIEFDVSTYRNNTGCWGFDRVWHNKNEVILYLMHSAEIIILTGDTSSFWHLRKWGFCRHRPWSPDRRCWCCRPEPAPALLPRWCPQRGHTLCWCCCYCPEGAKYRLWLNILYLKEMKDTIWWISIRLK